MDTVAKHVSKGNGNGHDGHMNGADHTHTIGLSEAHLQKLHDRGFTDATIKASRVWTASQQSVVSGLGFPATATGQVIPYHNPLTGEVILQRIRPDIPPLYKGKEAKYLSPKGACNRLFSPPDASEWIQNAAIPLTLTESEFKTLMAFQEGIECLGFAGGWGWRGKSEEEGPTGPIADLDLVTWQERVVTITYDSDVRDNSKVREARLALARELYRRGARVVYVVDLPHRENGEKNGLDDYLQQHGVDAYRALERHEIVPLPTIQISTHLSQMVDETEAALMQLPGPILFQRARTICQIAPAGKSPAWLQRPPDAPIIVPTNVTGLREYGDKAALWERFDKRDKKLVKCVPPTMLFETLAARVSWNFPTLEGIVDSPTIRPDGKLLTTPGFDAETGLFLNFTDGAFPAIPDRPTRDDARAALVTLYEPFADFPFATPASKSAAIAGALTLVGRYSVRGRVPAFAVRAHVKGTGKGLLVDTTAIIGTGRTAPTWTQTTDDAEEAKRMLSIAMAGDSCMHIDNVVKPFGSEKLDSAITSATVKDRLLGSNVNREAPWTTVLFASGNNMTFIGDMARRVVPIDLDSQCEHPENRAGFAHTPLLDWVHQERPRLVVAALTVLRAFFHADCPKQPNLPEYGSFEAWSNLIRHALVWCDWTDPNEGRENLEAESDTTYEMLTTLLQCWAECYPDGVARTLKVVIDDCAQRRIADPSLINPANEWNSLWDALASYDSKYDGKRLDTKRIGNSLRTVEGRVLDGVRLIRKGEFHRAALWKREILK